MKLKEYLEAKSGGQDLTPGFSLAHPEHGKIVYAQKTMPTEMAKLILTGDADVIIRDVSTGTEVKLVPVKYNAFSSCLERLNKSANKAVKALLNAEVNAQLLADLELPADDSVDA